MGLIRLNQLHNEVMLKVDEKITSVKTDIETTLQYTVGSTAPVSPSIGYRWFDTTSGLMKVWNGEGQGADWELINANAIYLPGRNTVENLSSTRKHMVTGTGFLEFGGRINSEKTVNRSMLANAGIPRIAGIIGEGDTGIKKFWFENFFLLNANGYDEENITMSSGEISEIIVNGSSIKLRSILPNSPVITNNRLVAVNMPSAPNRVDELHRDELVFIEVWKEDISETGYVFPYGNVQFTGEAADGVLTTPFNGEVGYCESYTGDCIVETQVGSDGSITSTNKPKGRGWVWKELKSVFKNIISANYQHNIFVDGDKLIQIRYRIRVVNFAKEPATPLTNTTVLGYTSNNDISTSIKAQGKLGTIKTTDDNYSILAHLIRIILIH